MYCLVLLSALLVCAAGVPLNTTRQGLTGRIFGGTVTDITSHPYQVSVLSSGSYRCSGSIISENWVVTIEFCTYGPVSTIAVMAGSTYSTFGGTHHSATRVIIHESYNPSNLDYDVALVQVFPTFTFSVSVQPITLECDPVPAGTAAVVTGWGSNPSTNQPLQQATLQTISDSECNNIYNHNGGITDSMICAEDPNRVQGACGDFGGPLVASRRLVGMYSWGSGCGSSQSPQVYTKVSAVCEWIVINARLHKVSAVINWIKPIPGLQTMPLTFIVTYPNN